MSTPSLVEQVTRSDDEAPVKVFRGDRSSLIGGGVLVVAVVVLAVWVPYNVSLGNLSDLVNLFVLIILGTTWNLLAGYGGMVSVGQQAFIGVGGYATVKLGDSAGLPVIVSVVAAGVLCALLALPTSFLVFRLVGGYFAIGTWVAAETLHLLTEQFDSLGSGSGLSVGAFASYTRVGRVATVYWLSLALMVFVVLATYLLMRSRVGMGLTAIRDSAVAAANVGVRVNRGKRIVYLAAAGGAGLAGGLLALNNLRVAPDASYSVLYTAQMIFVVVIGGIGTIEGPIVGAVIFYALDQELSQHGTWYLIALGVVAIVLVLLAPQGVWGLLTRGRVQVFPVGYRVRQNADKT